MTENSLPPRYEEADAQPRVAIGLAAFLAMLVVLGLVAARFFLARGAPGEGTQEAGAFPGGSRYRTSVEVSWAEYERDSRAHLSGYGWVDRRAGVVHIPIERAIELVCAAPQAGQPQRRNGGSP